MVESDPVSARTALALRALLFGLGPLHERLEEACDALLLIQSRELPETLRSEFVLLLQRIPESAPLSTLSDEDTVALAEAIVVFHEHVRCSV